MSIPYQRSPTDMDLSISAIEWAFGEVGYRAPVLRFHPSQLVTALALQAKVNGAFTLQPDSEMGDEWEWTLEWDGKRVGSPGA